MHYVSKKILVDDCKFFLGFRRRVLVGMILLR